MIYKIFKKVEAIHLAFAFVIVASASYTTIMANKPKSSSHKIHKYAYCKGVQINTHFDRRKQEYKDIVIGLERKEANKGFQNVEEKARAYHNKKVLADDIAMWNKRTTFCHNEKQLQSNSYN